MAIHQEMSLHRQSNLSILDPQEGTVDYNVKMLRPLLRPLLQHSPLEGVGPKTCVIESMTTTACPLEWTSIHRLVQRS